MPPASETPPEEKMWQPVTPLPEERAYNAVEVRLNASGLYALMMFRMNFNWRGDWYSVVSVDTAADYKAFLARILAEKTSIETFETLVAASHGVHFINVGENNKWSWAESKVSIKDNVVLVRNFGFRGDDRVFAVGNNGSFDTLCQWTSPADQDEPLSAFAVNSDNASTDIEDKVLAYRDTLRTMLGAGDPCGGTIGTEYTLLANGNQAARQALTQPWALGAHWPEARGIEVYLRWWSAQGLWERKLFRAYNAQRPLAQKALEKHYASSFGMAADDATALAATALDAILSHYISVSSEEPYATDDELRLYISDLANPKSDKKKISAQLGLHAALVLDLKPSAVLTRSCS